MEFLRTNSINAKTRRMERTVIMMLRVRIQTRYIRVRPLTRRACLGLKSWSLETLSLSHSPSKSRSRLLNTTLIIGSSILRRCSSTLHRRLSVSNRSQGRSRLTHSGFWMHRACKMTFTSILWTGPPRIYWLLPLSRLCTCGTLPLRLCKSFAILGKTIKSLRWVGLRVVVTWAWAPSMARSRFGTSTAEEKSGRLMVTSNESAPWHGTTSLPRSSRPAAKTSPFWSETWGQAPIATWDSLSIARKFAAWDGASTMRTSWHQAVTTTSSSYGLPPAIGRSRGFLIIKQQ